MPSYHFFPQFAENNRCNYSNATLSFICSLALAVFLTGYISSSNAASTTIAQEKQSIFARVDAKLKSKQNKTSVDTSAPIGWIKNRILVTPRAGLPAQEMEKALKPHGAKLRDHLKSLNVHIYELPADIDEVKVMRKLKRDRRFKNVELDMIVAPDLFVTDPAFKKSWALSKIQAATAWNTSNGDGIIIAILDTGVNGNHPDLAANMVPGWNIFDNNADTTDIHGHGTMVAGAAAAAANNGAGSAGVSWGASIMPVRISGADGFAYTSTIAEGIRWAADHGARVVNNSFAGVAGSPTVQAAAEYLRSKGGVVVVSAGNTGGLLNYTTSDSLLVAAATSSSDQHPSWSSYGSYVDISAPGVSIYTTTRNGVYGYASGTSLSSPIVAATAALVLSANNDLTPVDVDHILKSTAIDLGKPGFDNFYGVGRVDAAAAVAAASALISRDDQAPIITIDLPTGSEISGIVPVDVNYSDNVSVVRTELFVNGQKIITDSQAPFAFSWDTTLLADGNYTLTAYAYDAAGNEGISLNVPINIRNHAIADNEAPAITIAFPIGGEISGIVPVNVNYSDDTGVVRTELYVNGQKTVIDNQAPFSFNWDTTMLDDGNYTLIAYAFDEANNEGISTAISVKVNNAPPADTTPAEITGFNLADGMRVRTKQTINVSATDNHGVAQIMLAIDGKKVAESNSSALSYNWNTRSRLTPRRFSRKSSHTVTVQVFDHAGNTTNKTVTVYN